MIVCVHVVPERGNVLSKVLVFTFFNCSVFLRREKQSLERYLKDVPTVEEHQKLTKTISFVNHAIHK